MLKLKNKRTREREKDGERMKKKRKTQTRTKKGDIVKSTNLIRVKKILKIKLLEDNFLWLFLPSLVLQ